MAYEVVRPCCVIVIKTTLALTVATFVRARSTVEMCEILEVIIMKYNKSYVGLRETGAYEWRSCGRSFVVYISLKFNYEQSSSDQAPLWTGFRMPG